MEATEKSREASSQPKSPDHAPIEVSDDEQDEAVLKLKAPPPHKVRWLKDWNSSHLTREALHFPAKGFTDKDLEIWLNKASFWAGIREYCPLNLHLVFC
jgi:hypothetical protein